MVGFLFESENTFNNLNIIKKPDNFEICQIAFCTEYDYKFAYTVSNGNPYMHQILTQQLINEDSNIVVFLSEIEGLSNNCNITDIKSNIELPEEPKLVKLNSDLVLQGTIELNINSIESGIVYTCSALDSQLLLLKIPKNVIEAYMILNKILSDKINDILKSERDAYKKDGDMIDLGYAMLDAFNKVTDKLVYFAKTNNIDIKERGDIKDV